MALRSRLGGVLLGVSVLAVLGMVPSWAQDPDKDTSTASEGPAPATATIKVYRRVPPYFGKIGLTPDQREKIYTIRGKHQQEISALKAKIEELGTKELTDCEDVLLDAQKKMLSDLRAAAKASRKGN